MKSCFKRFLIKNNNDEEKEGAAEEDMEVLQYHINNLIVVSQLFIRVCVIQY